MQNLSNDFSKNHFLKVQGFCTFNIYHETGRRKTASTSRESSKDIHGDCRDRKEFFRYEAAMSMQKKEGCDMHSLPKEDAAQCRIEPTIQKRRIFRTAIRKK